MCLIAAKLYFIAAWKQADKFLLLVVAMVASLTAKAQLCSGSLGDPVIKITFGSGPNLGPPLSAATTNYVFNSTTCPNDGFYTVANSTSNFGNSWHTLNTDHTGRPERIFHAGECIYSSTGFLCGHGTRPVLEHNF